MPNVTEKFEFRRALGQKRLRICLRYSHVVRKVNTISNYFQFDDHQSRSSSQLCFTASLIPSNLPCRIALVSLSQTAVVLIPQI